MTVLPRPAPLEDLLAQASARLASTLPLLGGPSLRPEFPVLGDPGTLVSSLTSSAEAGPGALCFAVKPNFLREAVDRGAAAVVVTPELAGRAAGQAPGAASAPGPALAVCPEPRLLFGVILGIAGDAVTPKWAPASPFYKDEASCEIDPGVVFGPGCYIGAGVRIGPGGRIGPGVFVDDGVSMGRDCLIHPGVVLRFGTRLGDRCQIHANAVIGDDGFGYNQIPYPPGGRLIHYKNPHLGGVLIGDDVEIGSLAAIDRGLVSDTVVGRGTKIDNLVQIGHNCQIGNDCVVVAQAGAAGHSRVGDRAFVLGQAGLSHGAAVGEDAVIAGQSGVLGTIPPGGNVWTGTPAKPQGEEYRSQVMLKNDLPKWRQFLRLFLKGRGLDEIRREMGGGEAPSKK
ncbi:MAG: UDP-3-O-(3-hydroxymyristoyl)glucosamine N-acyltransferase [Deltaproteobacteria bacterium]|jgi:UDP-3-O-[3-hydroxymyristoyl] glucosamine N-acyltransferase|nr:UDP-3-O-(3-hydroxymyristoyl)glucosamine N-acyltransferase [Deltaproteobacteria bacterium]